MWAEPGTKTRFFGSVTSAILAAWANSLRRPNESTLVGSAMIRRAFPTSARGAWQRKRCPAKPQQRGSVKPCQSRPQSASPARFEALA